MSVEDNDPEIFFKPKNFALITELGNAPDQLSNQSINHIYSSINLPIDLI